MDHKVQDKYYRDLPVRYKDKFLFMRPRSRENKMTLKEIDCSEVKTKEDRRIVEEWTQETEEKETIFDAPPLTEISEERLQWVPDTIDRNRQAWEQSVEEKSTAESMRGEAGEIVEAAGEIIDVFNNACKGT
ncbi:hypothetical protein Tcan_07606 [Toxocara canis]|uniref:Uncharacterized protein n=1 Tax=Toxocara canis TaxID=6265 RepID=A0A0B2VEQ4_TOXCA|nr:hypothetical protein Tcan_07606 [Toxocara canis]